MVQLKDSQRHHLSLWINVPSCLSQSDLDFMTFTTQVSTGRWIVMDWVIFYLKFVRENLSEHLEV